MKLQEIQESRRRQNRVDRDNYGDIHCPKLNKLGPNLITINLSVPVYKYLKMTTSTRVAMEYKD